MKLGERLGLALGIPTGIVISLFVVVPFLNSFPLHQRFFATNVAIAICVILIAIAAVSKSYGNNE